MTSCQGLGGTGTKYTYAQLEGLWINAGGPKAVAPVAAAIALAESGGCSTALNPDDNGGTQSSFGLWQISNGTHNPPAANIYDAAVNAGQAVGKYNGAGGSFSPWGTYDSGAYKAYLSGSTTPDLSAGAGGGTAGAQTDALIGGCDSSCLWCLNFGSLFAGCVLSKSQARAFVGAAALLAGAGVLLVGALILAAGSFQQTSAGRAASQAIGAIPGGAAARAVRLA